MVIGMAFAYTSTISNTVKFFPEKKGLVSGVMTASLDWQLKKAPEYDLKINEVDRSAGKHNIDKTSKEMLKMPRFYILAFMLLIGSAVGIMITSQAATMAQEMVGVTASKAAIAVSMFALANTGGRLLWGLLSVFS